MHPLTNSIINLCDDGSLCVHVVCMRLVPTHSTDLVSSSIFCIAPGSEASVTAVPACACGNRCWNLVCTNNAEGEDDLDYKEPVWVGKVEYLHALSAADLVKELAVDIPSPTWSHGDDDGSLLETFSFARVLLPNRSERISPMLGGNDGKDARVWPNQDCHRSPPGDSF